MIRAVVGLALGAIVLAFAYRELLAYQIPLGPSVTLLAWLGLWLACRMRSRPCPFSDSVSWYELAPAAIAAVFAQLLLDMHTRYLGDAIVGAAHAIALITIFSIARNRRRPPS